MQTLTNNCRVVLRNEEIKFFCECGAPAGLAQSAEGAKVVWGYVCSREGHALTDFGNGNELTAFQQEWRSKLTNVQSK